MGIQKRKGDNLPSLEVVESTQVMNLDVAIEALRDMGAKNIRLFSHGDWASSRQAECKAEFETPNGSSITAKGKGKNKWQIKEAVIDCIDEANRLLRGYND
jgi:hypothetical protein